MGFFDDVFGGLFGSKKPKVAYGIAPAEQDRYYQAYGFPDTQAYHRGARPQNLRAQATGAVDDYTRSIEGLAGRFEGDATGNVEGFVRGLNRRGAMVGRRGEDFGSALMQLFNQDAGALSGRGDEHIATARQYGARNEGLINQFYDREIPVAGNRALAGYANRGLEGSTLAGSAASAATARTMEARDRALAANRDATTDRVLAAQRFAMGLDEGMLGQRPSVAERAFSYATAGDPYFMRALEGRFAGNNEALIRALGLREAGASNRAQILGQPSVIYPDVLPPQLNGQVYQPGPGLGAQLIRGGLGLGFGALGNFLGLGD